MSGAVAVSLCAVTLVACGPSGAAAVSDGYRTYYEVFVGSFDDSNGDGVGDLAGITAKLPYIHDDLGADGLWLTPINTSPSYHKYDVSDFEAIDPQFGTMQDFEALVAKAHQKDVRVLMDLVIQHTSSQHPWFLQAIEALKAGTTNKYVHYYNFSSTPKAGYVQYGSSGIYYSAVFSPGMPDLNLDDPGVRSEIAGIAGFWLGKGVDGFRLDATTSYYPHDAAAGVAFMRWLKSTCTAVNPHAYLVGEAWTDASTLASSYASGVDSFFNYPFATVSGKLNAALTAKDGTGLSQATQAWNATLHAANPDAMDAPFISNHDNPRPSGYLMRSSQLEKLTAATYLLMPGSPFIYYGEEIGMVGSGSDPDKRMPMVWSATATAGVTKPPPGGTYDESAVVPVDAQLKDPGSVLAFYRAVLGLRHRYPAIARGTYASITASDRSVLAFSDAYQGTTVYVLENLDSAAHVESLDAMGLPASARLRDHLLTDGTQTPSLSGRQLTLPPGSVAVLQ
jgi:glycosidase